MIDKNKIIKLAKTSKYKSHEIAKLVGCSSTTVFKVCRESNISLNNARKNSWEFNRIITPEFGYLLGIYLADGCLERDHESGKFCSFMIRNTTIQIINMVEKCIVSIDGKPRRRTPVNAPNTKTSYAICFYSVDFSNWVNNVFHYKKIIPKFMFNASQESKIAFIAGIIDGDGTISKTGYIIVKNTKLWIRQFPEFLNSAKIRTTGLKKTNCNTTKKPYYSVSINRKDFVPCYIVHPIKRHRIDNPEKQKKHKSRWVLCPDCKKNKKQKNSTRCRGCHLKHPATLEQLRINREKRWSNH